jgi:hypothetical protein
MFNIPVNAVSLIEKHTVAGHIDQGDRVKLLMNEHGYAALASNTAVRFSPEDYELLIPDAEFDKLLA